MTWNYIFQSNKCNFKNQIAHMRKQKWLKFNLKSDLMRWIFQYKCLFCYIRTSSREAFLSLWIISLVGLSHYIRIALGQERYSTPTHLSFEPTGFALDASPNHPQPSNPSLLTLHTDQNLHSRWALCSSAITVARDVRAALCVCVGACAYVRACTKGLAALTCRKDVKSVITWADNKWFSRVWMCAGCWVRNSVYIQVWAHRCGLKVWILQFHCFIEGFCASIVF